MKRKNNAFVLMEYDAFSRQTSALFVASTELKVKSEQNRLEKLGDKYDWKGLHYTILPTYVEGF